MTHFEGSNSMDIPERDWKRVRSLKPTALDRFCARVLAECSELIGTPGQTNHERYLALFAHLQRRNEDLAAAFDDLRRSTGIPQLAQMRKHGLVTDDEFRGFSHETREKVALLVKGIHR